MEEFLIGTGIALLMALLAWSDSIRGWHKETLEAEKKFYDERNIKGIQIKSLLRSNSVASEKLVMLASLLNSNAITENTDIDFINRFNHLDTMRNRLSRCYSVKYIMVILLAFFFIVSGFINLFLDDSAIINLFGLLLPADYILISVCILSSLLVLIFSVFLDNFERDFRDTLAKIEEDL